MKAKYTFTCPKCGYKFIPTFWRWFIVPHIFSMRYFRCDKCKKLNWMKRKTLTGKLRKRFKSWLIRKLGGYEVETFEVKRTYLPVITIESRIALNHFANFTTEQITEELCHKLADRIAPYINIIKDEDPINFPFSDIYVGQIKIVKED